MPDFLDPNEIMFKAFQPKVQNRFIMIVDGIPSFLIKNVSKPEVQTNVLKLDHINTYRKIAGKSEWQSVSMTLYDPIVPSGAQAVIEWFRLHYESVTGRAGYTDFYKKDVTIHDIGPLGDIVGEWTLKGAFIESSNFGQHDWATDDPVEIAVTLAYDYAILQF